MRFATPFTITFLGALLVLLGLTVCAGWLLHEPRITQILPGLTPMQFNTALLFAASGIALLCIRFERRHLATAIAAVIGLFAALTMAQYLTGASYGIDQLFVNIELTANKTSHPGRMVPNTTLAFILGASSLVLLSAYRSNFAAAMLGSLVLVTGLMSLLGYVFGLETVYGWSGLTRMTLHTSVGFVVLGSALVLTSVARTGVRAWDELPWLGLVAGLGLAVFSLLGWQALEVQFDKQMATRINQRAAAIANELAIRAHERSFALLRMSTRYANGIYRNEAEWATDIDANLASLPSLEQVLIRNPGGPPIWRRSRSPQGLAAPELPDLSAVARDAHEICPVILQGEKLWVVCNGRRSNGQPFQMLASLRLEIMTEILVRNQSDQGFSLSVLRTADLGSTAVSPRNGIIYGQATVPAPLDMLSIRIEAGESIRATASRLPDLLLMLGLVLAALVSIVIAQAQLAQRRAHDLSRTNLILERRTQALHAANESLEQFAYTASHDLKAPVRSMVGFAQLLERRIARGDISSVNDFTEEIVKAGHSLSSLIDAMLEVARAGRIQPERLRKVAMRETLDAALTALRALIEERQADIEIGPLPAMETDPVLLAQVWQNLVGNAVKYQPEGRPHIRISAKPATGGWEFCVADRGPGIDLRLQEDIFKLFRRGAPVAGVEGSGIGLAIVRRIINGLTGKIWVESLPGQGAQFKFFLPDQPLLKQG